MRTQGDKKATTIRLAPDIKTRLENVARVSRKSESSIVEQALTEYFKNHGYNTRYVMGVNDSCFVLIKQEGEHFTVLDQQVRNGVPIETIRERYRARLDSPVELLIEEGDPK